MNILKKIQQNNAWRQRKTVEYRESAYIKLNKQRYCNFTSNDYLNLSQHPEVKQAFSKAANIYGLGSSASALVSGYHQSHQILEESFADFLGRDKALLFNSGYQANLAIFQALANRHTWIFSDKYCHASLLDGIQLSRAKHRRFAHNDINAAKNMLDEVNINKESSAPLTTMLITESIFSMEGNVACLSKLARLCDERKAFFCVDDAHGLGVLGEKGRGACEHFQLSQQSVPCLIQPLGKALGSMGAIVSGSDNLIETLIQCSHTYRYSTALPPAVSIATLNALQILQRDPWRRTQLQNHINLFNNLAQQYQLPLCSWDQTPIRSILIGCNKKTLAFQNALQKRGYFVACIRPPTVPEKTARLRISLTSEHSPEDIMKLVMALTEIFHAQE